MFTSNKGLTVDNNEATFEIVRFGLSKVQGQSTSLDAFVVRKWGELVNNHTTVSLSDGGDAGVHSEDAKVWLLCVQVLSQLEQSHLAS
jgi:hypothetical protein